MAQTTGSTRRSALVGGGRSGAAPRRVLDATFERTRGSRQHLGWRALLGDRAAAVPAFGLTVVVVLVAAVGFKFYADRSVVGDQRGAYVGNWETTDDPPDRSHLTMEIVRGRGRHVPRHDSR